MSNLRSSILALVVPVSCLLVWWIACESGAVDPLFLASPLAVGSSLAELLREGSVLQDAAATVARALTAFGLAVAIGAPLGVLVGRSRALQLLLTPAVDFARSIPATAFFPLFMLLFGIGDTSKVAVAFYASALIFFVYVVSASRQITADRLACAKLLGASRLDLLFRVAAVEASPGVLAGCRVSLSMSLVLVIVSEMFVGASVGLGQRLVTAQLLYKIPDMYSMILLTGIIGFLQNGVLLYFERRAGFWVGK